MLNVGANVSQLHTRGYSPHLLVPITLGVRATPLNLSWTNPYSLTYHFTEHGAEFPGVLSEADYLAEAKAFWSKPITSPSANGQTDIVEKRGSRGPRRRGDANFYKLYRFERSTGTVSVIEPDPQSPSALLVTLFKPGIKKPLQARLSGAQKYFDRQ